MRPRQFARAASAFMAVGLGGCAGSQSALDPFGPQAGELAALFWFFTAILTLVWLITVAALLLALRAERARDGQLMVKVVAGAIGTTAVVLLLLTGLSYASQSRLYGSSSGDTVAIRVTGHQWWWEVRYEDVDPQKIFSTANEIHVPAGRPIEITLSTADVIHSFWVPGLFGKMDLVNGVENKIRFSASRLGTLRGQCAEFCGLQHAHMSFAVVVETPEAYRQWRVEQLKPAKSSRSAPGQQIFLSKPCTSCHSVRGSLAGGRVGPDLTHFASRKSIAAGTLPMTRGALAAWIVDPQSIKPGANMPAVRLEAGEIHPLLDYLEGLQ
jgi:cytochrome c oxidase subunit 2